MRLRRYSSSCHPIISSISSISLFFNGLLHVCAAALFCVSPFFQGVSRHFSRFRTRLPRHWGVFFVALFVWVSFLFADILVMSCFIGGIGCKRPPISPDKPPITHDILVFGAKIWYNRFGIGQLSDFFPFSKGTSYRTRWTLCAIYPQYHRT